MGSNFDKELMDEGYDGIDDEEKCEIKIKGPGEIESFKISKNLLVKYLVARYKNRVGLCKDTRVQLIYRGKPLNESKTLGDYILNDDDYLVFHAMIRMAGC